MTQPEAVFFDCDGTLVDSEVICSRAYVHMFQEFGITLDLAEIFKRFKGVKLYEIIDTINVEHGVNLQKATLEPIYRAEVARLFDSETGGDCRSPGAAGCGKRPDVRGLQWSGQ